MQRKPLLSASTIRILTTTAATLLLAGCGVSITNLTSTSARINPSQIYTIQARVRVSTDNVDRSSVSPKIVIDGEVIPMQQSTLSPDVYEYEYHLPRGRDNARYYYLLNYQCYRDDGTTYPCEKNTGLYDLRIADRFVFSLETNRGPAGARIALAGRGFLPGDTVWFNKTPARTLCETANSIVFFVPAVAPGVTYAVTLVGAKGSLDVGTFRVDAFDVDVQPADIRLAPGGKQDITFSVSQPAPAGGLLVDVTTDIPASVILPEVIIPEGQTSITVKVQGGRPGTGTLFIPGAEKGELRIPFTVAAPQ